MSDTDRGQPVDAYRDAAGQAVDKHRGQPVDKEVTGPRGHGQVGLYTHRPPVAPPDDPLADIYATARPRPGWHDDAACAGLPLRLFFPGPGESAAPAQAVCARCLVRVECAEWAVADASMYGICGGLTERERTRLRSAGWKPQRKEHDRAAT